MLSMIHDDTSGCITVFEVTTILHGMKLLDNEVKVMIGEIVIPYALVLMPADE